MAAQSFFHTSLHTLAQLPRLLKYSFLPVADGAYSQFSLQRLLVMLLFWPLFLFYLLVTALGLALDHLLFPGFRQVSIRNPLFVIGIPRSGTTFLHRLLAGDDSRYTTMTLQELIFAPSISQRMFWRRLASVDRGLGAPLQSLLGWLEQRLFSQLDGVHSTRLNDPEEDYLTLAPILHCFLLILPFGDPALMRLSRFDVSASEREKKILIEFYRGLMQRHLWYHCSRHGIEKSFLSKNPSFTPMAKTLRQGFPDARFIACVRNPDKAVPSQISSILIGARLFSGRVKLDWWRRELVSMLTFYYQHLLQLQAEMPQQQWALARMEQLAGAPGATVTALYQQLQLEASANYESWLQLEDERARQFRSGHHYQNQQLGISHQLLQQQFAFAYQQLGYPLTEL